MRADQGRRRPQTPCTLARGTCARYHGGIEAGRAPAHFRERTPPCPHPPPSPASPSPSLLPSRFCQPPGSPLPRLLRRGRGGSSDGAFVAASNGANTWGECSLTFFSDNTLVIGGGRGLPRDENDSTAPTEWSAAAGGSDNIWKIRFEGEVTLPGARLNGLFGSLGNLESIEGIEHLDTADATDMGRMFYGCSKLKNLDLSSFDTSRVANMNFMFFGCSSLTSLDLSSFDASQVTNMQNMFNGCSSLNGLVLSSSFDTSSVTNMANLFKDCNALASIDLSSFDTSKVTDMQSMFSGCSSLTSLDPTPFDTSQVTGMEYMFSGCSDLVSLDLSAFDTSKVTDMHHMFDGCTFLASLDLTLFDTSKVKNMSYMFRGCSSLASLDLSSFDTSKVTDLQYMFNGCSSLTSLDLSSFAVNSGTYARAALTGVSGIDRIMTPASDTDGQVLDAIPAALEDGPGVDWYDTTDPDAPDKIGAKPTTVQAQKFYAVDKEVTLFYEAGPGGGVMPDVEAGLKSVTMTALGSTANPLADHVFVDWTDERGVEVSTEAHLVPQKEKGSYVPTTYTANFRDADLVAIGYAAGPGGKVTRDKDEVDFEAGVPEGSEAEPLPGYRFVRWVDERDVEVSTNALFVPQKADGAYVAATYTAEFEKIPAPVPKPATGGGDTLAATGDASLPAALAALGLASAAALALAAALRRRRG